MALFFVILLSPAFVLEINLDSRMPDAAKHIEKSPSAHQGVPARGERTHFQRGIQSIARARFSAY